MTSRDASSSDYSKIVSANLKMVITFISNWKKEFRRDKHVHAYMTSTMSARRPYKRGMRWGESLPKYLCCMSFKQLQSRFFLPKRSTFQTVLIFLALIYTDQQAYVYRD